jgi:hypothetical protein
MKINILTVFNDGIGCLFNDHYNVMHENIFQDLLHDCQAVSRWFPIAAARGSSPGLVMWDLWWTKWRWGRFFPSISVSPANLYSTNCSTTTLIYHLGLVQ